MKTETGRGLNLSFEGAPARVLESAPASGRVAYLGADYPGLRVELLVEQGQAVTIGTPLCRDRRRKEIVFCATANGIVTDIVIGARRHVTAIIITPDEESTPQTGIKLASPDTPIRTLMLQSGLWPALRTRPFDRIPDSDATPDAIFVTAIDTAPHAPDPAFVLAERGEDFARGAKALNHLTEGPVFICQSARTPLVQPSDQLIPVRWTGPHPAGLVGTHVARLFPLKDNRVIWHINYQDVAALGTLISTGRPDPLRTITLGGPGLRNPAYRRVPLGTDLHALLRPNLTTGQKRILSGSLLSGRESQFLSRYHLQASVHDAPPEKSRHWLVEALNKVACPAPFIPTQALEQTLGPDLPATPLLRALSIGDADRALQLGCLHLGEEDLALASYVTGGVTDFGRQLRVVLNMLETGS